MNQIKKAIWLVTLFTIGHSITLGLSAFNIIKVNIQLVEFLIPVTIFFTGFVNILTAKKNTTTKGNTNLIFALFFGLIHGLGFSNYFRMMIGKEDEKLTPLIEFALGIELAQILIVICVLIIGSLFYYFTKITRRDYILVASSIVIGFAIQMMSERIFW